MMTINANKTTGVVTSVPSDSPDDYAALEDLKNKEALRTKFGVKDEWVIPFNPVPIIQVEGESDMYAVQVCKEMKIRSQNDRTELEQAHEVVYKKGFYQGTMKVGKYAGKKVEEAKPLIRQDLINSGEADVYAEPAGEVISRSNDVCVVALSDQWYLDYGEEKWLALTKKALKGIDCYHDEVQHQFESALGWLRQWACSREFGLGTKLPWDERWLIESLSDSTIYMAYYTGMWLGAFQFHELNAWIHFPPLQLSQLRTCCKETCLEPSQEPWASHLRS
jgi:leucyl-tRNA synthetase